MIREKSFFRENLDINSDKDIEIESTTIDTEKSNLARVEAELSLESENQNEKDLETLKEIREEIELVTSNQPKISENQSDYIIKYLPDYLTNKPSLVYKLFKLMNRFKVNEIIGKESLPTTSKLLILNHRGGETPKLISALDKPVHIASAQTINWGRGGLTNWFMKKMGMVPIQESFSHLNLEQQEAVVAKAPQSQRESHQQVVDGQKKIDVNNVRNIRAMVALLLNGEDVAIFSEGAFSRLDDDERRSYGGYALVAREFKRVTGEELPIVPTAIRDKKVAFGDSFFIDQGNRNSKSELEDQATEKIHDLYSQLQ